MAAAEAGILMAPVRVTSTRDPGAAVGTRPDLVARVGWAGGTAARSAALSHVCFH